MSRSMLNGKDLFIVKNNLFDSKKRSNMNDQSRLMVRATWPSKIQYIVTYSLVWNSTTPIELCLTVGCQHKHQLVRTSDQFSSYSWKLAISSFHMRLKWHTSSRSQNWRGTVYPYSEVNRQKDFSHQLSRSDSFLYRKGREKAKPWANRQCWPNLKNRCVEKTQLATSNRREILSALLESDLYWHLHALID